jgi:acyl-CoA thioester hydrolase
MQELHFGPIIFREECVFRKEIRNKDKVTIDLELIKGRKDYSRWSFRHTIRKNGDTVSAVLTIDGAWMNTKERKLALPPAEATSVFSQMPVSADFQWTDH